MASVAGILPLNYARSRQNRLYHAIIKGYGSRSRAVRSLSIPLDTRLIPFDAVGYTSTAR